MVKKILILFRTYQTSDFVVDEPSESDSGDIQRIGNRALHFSR